ncbi:MAG TPA: amino acid adenylation domain-containing protein, partial [Thermoanaerobaculia bacterium]
MESVALHRRILELPPRKRALLAARNPLSFSQERLWFIDQLTPGSPVYNIPFALRLEGDLDPQVLRLAVREVLHRHDVLRTTFAAPDGRPMQVVHPPAEAALPLIDLTGLPTAAREASARRLVALETASPFDLARGPLLRSALLRLGEHEHILCGAMHHIVSDGWSLEVLIREISTLCTAFLSGEPSPLPELPIQYLDYARWQRDPLRGQALREQLEYWKRTLAGAPPVHELPTDRPRPKAQSHGGARRSLFFPAEVGDGLRRVGRQASATLFATLLGAFMTLLGRVSGRDDQVVGSPVAGRSREELEPLIGFFVNMLVLRGDLSGNPRFSELLLRLREVVVGAQTHQDLPFERLVEELQPERNLSHSPLFQIAFGLLVPPREELELPGLRLRRMLEEATTSMFDLRLLCAELDGGVSMLLEYSTDLFCAATIDRFLRQLQTLVTAIAAAPEQRLWDLPLLDEAERREILALVEAERREVPARGLLHEIFAEQAARRPEAVALTCEGAALSYGELDRRSSRLAHRLRALGVGPDVRVALCLERSLDLVVGLVAVLKAGGAYVPLDPAYPAERLAFMLEDSQARVLLTRGDLAGSLPAGGPERLLLDREEEPVGGSSEPPATGARPENAAYVIYTSGSTGRPKGVVVTHANVVRLFAATRDDFGFDGDDVWTLFHSYAFDFSVWEIWGALLHGGRLVVVPYWTSRSPEAFHELLCRERVTVLNQTPSAFLQLSHAEESGAARGELSLEWVVFGGEALDLQSLAPWLARHGDSRPRLVNMYGITETTVHVTFRPLSATDAARTASVIGPPLADLRLYVLDRAGELALLGVPGEIFVSGAGLARGYLRRPELTAERFVPDPFGAPGGRLYKTGDLARRLPGGEIEYLGRTDDQVKIRGFRIEIGEIQSALAACSGVSASAVLALPGESGGARLVAWWVPNGGPAPSSGELRDFLRDRLPEHMIPAAFVRLDRLPLTANGKLDRAALPVPSEAPAEETAHVPPRTPVEEVLAAVWAQVLRIDRVSVHDNFFALGGDSIRSVEVVALARERGLDFTVQDLFESQTVAGLAAGLGEPGDAAASPEGRAPFSLITAADRARLPADVEDAYPLTRLQAGMLYHMALDPEAPLYHNVVSWHLAGPFDAAALQDAVDRVVARHAVLRTSFDLASPGGPLQRVHREVPLPVEVEDLTALPAAAQERAIDSHLRRERGRPFDLARPPMLRMHVHRRSAGQFQLTLTENHAIFDGWSLHATLAEVFRIYFALLEGAEPPREPPPAFSFGDFVGLERAALESEETRAYWSRRMDDAPFSALPRWPAGVPAALGEKEVGPGVGGVLLALPPAVQSGIRTLARVSAVPVKSVLLAAHARVVGLVCGQESVVTGLVTHGRPESRDATEVRGLFLNTLPLRLDLAAGSWQDLVRAVFAAEWEMLPHRRYPLTALQEDLGGRPLFETGFNYIHFHVVDDVIRAGGLSVLAMKRSEGNNFTLMANFSQSPATAEMALGLEYGARDLTPPQAEAIAGYYLRTLEAMVRNPLAQHAAATLLSAPERWQILVEWNDTAAPVPPGATLPGLLAGRVERQPDAEAVVCGGETLTYRELLERARWLAGRLRRLGVGPETLVGLHTERTPEMLVGLWGILEAGGAYLPLDPALPEERLAWMLEDSAAPVVLTQRHLRGALPAWGGTALCLDGEELAGLSPDDRPAGAGPDNLAYVLYTSGSTGRPKGVPITHRNVVNFLGFMGPRLGITERDTLLAVTTLSFDISVLELVLPLVRGARIALVGPEVSTNGEALAEAIARHGATVMQATPATWQLLIEAGWRGREDFRILCGGEALPGDLAGRLLERGREVWNLYGPTETTIWSAVHRVTPEPGVAPLGRPIANTVLHVLDGGF